MLAQQVDGPLGKRISFGDPELPPDVGVDVVRLETHRVEDADRLREHGLTDSITGHGDHRST